MDLRISAIAFDSINGSDIEVKGCRSIAQLDQSLNNFSSPADSHLFIAETPTNSPSFSKIPVILCDPAPKTVQIHKTTVKLQIKAFENGYHGFIPDQGLGTKAERPNHLSLYDDLVYYFQTHADVLENLDDPFSATVFPRKIVASHYCQLLGFVSHQTASMRSSGWAVQRRTQREVDESNQVETAWSQFKCPEYLEALGAVLDSLGISQSRDPYEALDVMEADSSRVPGAGEPQQKQRRPVDDPDWLSPAADFLYLHREFRSRLADYARMTSSLAALNGMIGGRISILEARTAKSLTLVAMIFAPPACVASIFSIPADVFGQQGPKFWWYWAAALPITVVVFLVTYVVHERDGFMRMWQTRKPVVCRLEGDDY
ncbi:hypothetical protein VPNG_06844 [Cytospora leucostoma]|uniref:Uncharacterized protein n=1 Tax=Cytospora leucostoma TaxID=1230097 RepID=A0A423WVS7_9PEZI|nr:hypothetical protein VPNG_06844 [Cytospora leucostoma]